MFLIIHGYGADEKDLFFLAKELPANFFVVSLQALHPLAFGGFAWYAIDFSGEKPAADLPQAIQARKKITSFINEAVVHYKLDKDHVWLCGFSQGAILSYAIALHHPEKVSKVIALSGFPHKDLLPKEDRGNDHTQLDFFISHGKEDLIIPITWARQGPIVLDHYKIPYLYKEYEAGHGLNKFNYEALMQWIKSR
ncbi:MAG: alpha/beta fold hydrolase [Flavobacteriales bacterium]